MGLKEAIAKIIDTRKAKANKFNERMAVYDRILADVQSIITAKQMINGEDPAVIELLGKRFVAAMERIDATEFENKYQVLKRSIQDVQARYNKDEINISVVGAARQGKSKLLQSISGLSDHVIPAFPETDCTGAVSVIHNVPGAGVTARVYFNSEAAMKDMVNQYIATVADGVVPKVLVFDDIAKVNITAIEEHERKVQAGNDKKIKQLSTIVKHFSEWAEYVKKYDRDPSSFLEIRDADKIMQFVAQHNGYPESDGRRQNYYNWIAVKKVDISCEFVYKDAGRIVLRDTVGLGDNKMVNLENSMLDSVATDCDAAIVIKRPETSTGDWVDSDNTIYRNLHDYCISKNIEMNKWFFYVINHTTANSPFGDNGNCCDRVIKYIENGNLAVADSFMVDVSSPDSVTNDVVIPILTQLQKNLPELDAVLESLVEEAAEAVYVEYKKLCEACIDAAEYCDIESSDRSVLGDLFSEKWTNFGKFVGRLKEEYASKENDTCVPFVEAVRRLDPTKDIDTLLPTQDFLISRLSAGDRSDGPSATLSDSMHTLRNDFTQMFVDMDETLNELVKEVQKKIAEELQENWMFDKLVKCRLENYADKLKKDDPDLTDKEISLSLYSRWITEAYKALDKAFKNDPKFENLIRAFKFIADFNMSVRSFLMYRVRACIDLLDPSPRKNPAPLNDVNTFASSGASYAEIADFIREILSALYINAYNELNAKIGNMYKEPNQLLYASVAEYCDRTRYSVAHTDRGDIDIMLIWKDMYECERGKRVFMPERYAIKEMAEDLKRKFDKLTSNVMSEDQFLGR